MAGEKQINPMANLAGSDLAAPTQQGMKGIARDLSQRAADLPRLAEAEQRQLLADRNDTNTGSSPDKCVHNLFVHDLFETQVDRTPNAVALVYTKGAVSYRELDNQATRVAIHLRSLGAGPAAPVGICVRHSTDMGVGLLGLSNADGAYLPLDTASPKQRPVWMSVDSRTPVQVLTQSPSAGRFQFQTPNCREVCLESL